MKKTILIVLLTWSYAFAQVKNGEKVPNLEFNSILNSPVKRIKLNELNGKVVLIEFWATWCSPCIAAMPQLEKLQKKFKDKLQIINVTDESVKRVNLFLKARPTDLWFAVDTSKKLSSLFPYQTIPHTVLIDAEGKLITNTSIWDITEEVMTKLIRKEKVILKEKLDSNRDFVKDYFFAADTVNSRLLIQPEIKDGPSMSRRFNDEIIFKGRRLTMINLTLKNMYQIAYGDLAYGRIVNKVENDDKINNERFCMDLITRTPEELLPTLKRELLKRFDLQAKIERFVKPVYVLKVEDKEKVKQISLSEIIGKGSYGAGSGTFSGDGVVFADISDYLENYGIVNLPVVDETGIETKFNIQLVFERAKPETLTKALSDIGLKLEKTERPIDMLILYK